MGKGSNAHSLTHKHYDAFSSWPTEELFSWEISKPPCIRGNSTSGASHASAHQAATFEAPQHISPIRKKSTNTHHIRKRKSALRVTTQFRVG